MMYLKLNADYKQGELVPLLDDAIYVYCDVCKSLHRIKDVSHAAFGSCSFGECKIVCVNRYCMNLLYAPYWGKQR